MVGHSTPFGKGLPSNTSLLTVHQHPSFLRYQYWPGYQDNWATLESVASPSWLVDHPGFYQRHQLNRGHCSSACLTSLSQVSQELLCLGTTQVLLRVDCQDATKTQRQIMSLNKFMSSPLKPLTSSILVQNMAVVHPIQWTDHLGKGIPQYISF
jgi:hypothetical protein